MTVPPGLPALRDGVSLLSAPAGLLAHDPHRWLLFQAPHGLPPEKLARWLSGSQLLADGPAAPLRTRKRQWHWLPPSWVPSGRLEASVGARYSCAACGSSCKDLAIGPMPAADVALLLSLPLGEAHPADDLFCLRTRERITAAEALEGNRDIFLRRTSTGCTLLQPNGHCTVHSLFGVEKKPLLCRLFPFEFIATPRSVRVHLRLDECARGDEVVQGQPVDEQLPELTGLFARCEKVPIVPPALWLTPGRLVRFEELEARLAGLDSKSAERSERPGAEPAGGPRSGSAIGAAPAAIRLFRALSSWAGHLPAPHGDLGALDRLTGRFAEVAAELQALPTLDDEIPLADDSQPPLRRTAFHVISHRVAPAAHLSPEQSRAASALRLDPAALDFEERVVEQDRWSLRLLDAPDLLCGAAIQLLRTAVSRRLAARLALQQGEQAIRPSHLIAGQVTLSLEQLRAAAEGASPEALAEALALVELEHERL
jgi:Fe-S-cluster containining protein